MHITGNELTASSSIVAALAIVGGYLSVRSANHNALMIAREERSSNQKEMLDDLKRATYVKLLVALGALAAVSLEQTALLSSTNTPTGARLTATRKRIEAVQVASDCIAELSIVSDNVVLKNMANEAFIGATNCSNADTKRYIRGASKLRASMRNDLRGEEISSPEELNRMVDIALAKTSASSPAAEAERQTPTE